MRRRTAAAAVAALLPIALAACGADDPPTSSKAPAAGGCESVRAAPKAQTFAAAPSTTPDPAKSYAITFATNCGTITAKLFAAEAPATVASFEFLAGKQYFDGTVCHRTTETSTLTVLQCGDPSGDGTGGPGYTLPEENLPIAAGPVVTYPRGTLAMARTSAPHSGGSQFFLVIRDSRLPPDYTIFGTVTEGLGVLDAILAIGIDDADGETARGLDGAPKQPVVLKTVRVTAT